MEIPYSTVHRIVRYQLHAKLKVARLTSIHRDDIAVVEFKKKRPDRLELIDVLQYVQGNPTLPLRYWSQDESRIGLKTITRCILTALGVKPVGPMQWIFQSFYLYGAVEPLTGDSFFLEFSHLDADCFQIFLEQFSQAHPHSLNVIQLNDPRQSRGLIRRTPQRGYGCLGPLKAASAASSVRGALLRPPGSECTQ